MLFTKIISVLCFFMVNITDGLSQLTDECEPDWIPLKSVKCYKIYDANGKANISEAQSICRNTFGAQVVTIQSQEEQIFVTELLDRINNTGIMIGARSTIQVTFHWIDGSQVKYSGWAPGEPNGVYNVEGCVEMQKRNHNNGKWNDVSCSTQLPFICEKTLTQKNTSAPPPNSPEREGPSTLLIMIGVLALTFLCTSIFMCVGFFVFNRMQRKKKRQERRTLGSKVDSTSLYERQASARYFAYNEVMSDDAIYETIDVSGAQDNPHVLPIGNEEDRTVSYLEVVPRLPDRSYADVQ